MQIDLKTSALVLVISFYGMLTSFLFVTFFSLRKKTCVDSKDITVLGTTVMKYTVMESLKLSVF